jgi:PAS domain S-box-containing protein
MTAKSGALAAWMDQPLDLADEFPLSLEPDRPHLRLAEVLPGLIMESIQDVAEVIDRDHVIRWTNMSPELCRFLGAETVTGRPCREVFGRLCRNCADCPLDKIMETGRKLIYDSQLHLPDGRIWWGRTHCYPLNDRRGEVIGGFMITFDINDEKRIEKRAEKYLDALEQSLHNRTRPEPDTPAEDLSARELEVLAYMADGLSNTDIGRLLNISLNTVKTHVAHIFNKLGVNDRTQAAVTATRLNII